MTAGAGEELRELRVEGIDADAVLYHDEVTARNEFLPRFIAEPVMAQLESEANLAKLSPSFRHLVVVITETGLRAGDACALAFESIVVDSAGWPWLRFYCSKCARSSSSPCPPGPSRPSAPSRPTLARRGRPAHAGCSRPGETPASPTATGCSAGRSRTGRLASGSTTAPAGRSK